MLPKISASVAAVVACMLTCVAHATRINIQDPTASFPITSITSSSFNVTFAPTCGALFPVGNMGGSQDGCFGFVNRTPSAWSALTLTVQAAPDAFHFTCNNVPYGPEVFPTVTSCGYDRSLSEYVLSFSGGTLPNDTTQYFIISEDDLPPGSLSFAATATYAVTPEPPAALLLATGLAGLALLGWPRRRGRSS